MGKGGFIEEINKTVKVQASKLRESKKGQRRTAQYLIHIPREIIEELKIEKGDEVQFHIPLRDRSKYTIRFKKAIK